MLTGFVSGCFDWTTPGHITLFKGAKSQCDVLHILVADDETVRHYKGENRPILPIEDRVHILQACKYLDVIHILRKLPMDDNQFDLIKKIKPDVYFEGPDQSDKQIQKYLDELSIERVVVPINHPRLSDILYRIKGENNA